MNISAILKYITAMQHKSKLPKILTFILISPFMFVVIVLGIFIALVAGLFDLIYGAVRNTAVQQSWNDIRKNVESALSGVNTAITTTVKNETYSFMPEFSVNLSKSVLQKTFSDGNDSFLLLYDTKEVNDSIAKSKEIINELQAVKSQQELEELNVDLDLTGFNYSDLQNDKAFLNDKSYDLTIYSENTVKLINALVKPSLPNYEYSEETIIIEGEEVKKQILTVNKDSKTQIVEYACYGEGDIYLPKLLALYEAEILSNFEKQAESDAEGLDNDVASAVGSVESDGGGGAQTDFTLATLNIFEAQEIGQIFQKAVTDGKFAVDVKTETNGNVSKLSIVVKTPSEDDWYELFEVEEQYQSFTEENTQIIERILSDSQIDNLYISVDSTAQQALFVYFQGFFNLPVEAEELKDGTNGILTTLNDFEKIHSRGTRTIGKSYESGITLYLDENKDIEVRAELLPQVGECIQDVYIYDVYDAENREVVKDKPNYTYNHSAVQLAYLIDTDIFAEEYGFEFPTIVSTTGVPIEHEGGVLTLMVEYSCLSALNEITETNIGSSLYDVYDEDEKIIIGYAHDGKHSKEKDEGLSATGWSHTFGSEIIPHLCVKTAFVDGEVTPPEPDNPHIYDGLSVRFVGAKVNPLLWFKAYRTDGNKDLLDSISAIQVK